MMSGESTFQHFVILKRNIVRHPGSRFDKKVDNSDYEEPPSQLFLNIITYLELLDSTSCLQDQQ